MLLMNVFLKKSDTHVVTNIIEFEQVLLTISKFSEDLFFHFYPKINTTFFIVETYTSLA